MAAALDILRHWRHRSIVLQRMWSKDGDPTRDWRGVTFEQSRADAFIRDRVTDIELDDTGLTGVIPVELAHLGRIAHGEHARQWVNIYAV